MESRSHPANARSPISAAASGKVATRTPELSQSRAGMARRLSGSRTANMCVAPAKAASPRSSTDCGSVTPVRLVHPANARAPTDRSEPGSPIPRIAPQPSNAPGAIAVTGAPPTAAGTSSLKRSGAAGPRSVASPSATR